MLTTLSVLSGELGTALRVAGSLIGLGLIMAFSPTTFGIEISSLEQRRQSRLRVLVIAGAVAVSASILAAVFLVVSPNTVHALWTGELRDLSQQHWLDAGVGAVLVVVGVVQWIRAAGPRRPHRARPGLDRPRVLFALVLGESLLSTTGPATMYLVVTTIGTTRPPLWPLEYGIFLVGLSAPYVFLAVALTQLPTVARRFAEVLSSLSRRDLRRPVAVLLVVVGLALLGWSATAIIAMR